MKCPADQAAMRLIEDKGISLDWCELCDGIWLDAGELTRLAQTASDMPNLPPPAKEARKKASNGRVTCPRCQQLMEELPYNEGTAFLVDRCTRCRGLWLERGELQKIYDEQRQRNPPPQEPAGKPDTAAQLVVGAVVAVLVLCGILLVSSAILHR